MIFTQQDYIKIKEALLKMSIKDTQFDSAETPIKRNDLIVIVQEGKNKSLTVQDFLYELGALGQEIPQDLLQRLQNVESRLDNIGSIPIKYIKEEL